MLTPATFAHLELSRMIARKLTSPSIAEIKDVILQCIRRDSNWIKVSRRVLVNLKADDELRLDRGKLAIRAAFDKARANQHEQAIAILDRAIDETGDSQEKAWLFSRKAAFQHPIDAHGAQKTLVAAHSLEPSVSKPMHGTTYKQLAPATGQQAATLITNHDARFMDPTDMRLFADELCSDLRFSPETADKFEASVNDLARFIGISGHRPERDHKEGPDNLWAMPSGSFLVIECKNGVTAESGISRRDAGQLGQSVAWFGERYPGSISVPILIHKERTLGQGGKRRRGDARNCFQTPGKVAR